MVFVIKFFYFSSCTCNFNTIFFYSPALERNPLETPCAAFYVLIQVISVLDLVGARPGVQRTGLDEVSAQPGTEKRTLALGLGLLLLLVLRARAGHDGVLALALPAGLAEVIHHFVVRLGPQFGFGHLAVAILSFKSAQIWH